MVGTGVNGDVSWLLTYMGIIVSLVIPNVKRLTDIPSMAEWIFSIQTVTTDGLYQETHEQTSP